MATTDHAAAGDAADFTRTLAESGPFLRRLAVGLVRDTHAAEDAVQETLSRAWAAGPAGVTKPRGWLTVILRNVVAGRRRSEGGATEAISDGSEPLAVEAGPEAIALRLERERTLHRELRGLDEPYRTALVLRFGSELSVAEVAAAMGIGQSAAQSRITRGKALLRERLEKRFDGERGWLGALAPLAVTRGAAQEAPRALAAAGGAAFAPAGVPSGVPSGVLIGLVACASVLIAALWFAALDRESSAGPAAIMGAGDAGAGQPVDPLAEVAARAAPYTRTEAGSPLPQESPPPAPSLEFHGKGKGGAPLFGLPMFVARMENEHLGPVRWAGTGPDGVARFNGLGPGNYKFCHAHQQDLLTGYSQTIQAAAKGNSVHGMDMGSIAVPVRFDFETEPSAEVTVWCVGYSRGVRFLMPCCTLEARNGLETQVMTQRRFFATREGWLPSPNVSVDPRLPRRDDGTYLARFGFKRGGAPVTGRVLRPDGEPAAGAVVAIGIGPSDSLSALTFTTDAEGYFQSPCHLPFGQLRVETMLPGCGVLRSTLQHGAAAKPMELSLPAERVLTGTVLTAAGEPAPHASVVATLSGEHYPTSTNFLRGALLPRPDARASKEGRFRIAGLPDRDVTLFAERGTSNASVRIKVPAGPVPEDGAVLQLRSSLLLAGRAVQEDGAPLAELRLEVRQEGTGAAGWTETADDGSFEIEASATDTWDPTRPLNLRVVAQYRLKDRCPALAHDLARRAGLALGTADLNLVLPAPPAPSASIGGRIAPGPGSPPLDELKLHVQSTSVYEGIDYRGFDEKSGRFSVGPIPPGTYDLIVSRSPHMTPVASRVRLEVSAGEQLDLGDIVPGTGGHVEVTVIDDATDLVLDAQALGTRALRLDAGERSMDHILEAQGSAWRTPWAVEPGQWTLKLRTKRYAIDDEEIEIVEGAITGIKLRVHQR